MFFLANYIIKEHLEIEIHFCWIASKSKVRVQGQVPALKITCIFKIFRAQTSLAVA